jgi:hypothetical protein
MAGTTLGFLKFVLGFDSLSFKKGMTQAEKDLLNFQKKVDKFGKGMTDIGAKMSLALTAPLLAFAAKGIKEAQETAHAMGQVEAALKSMGPVAGKTADQLAKSADAFEAHSLYEADEILTKVTANLLTFGKISGATFDRAQQAALDLSARLGTDLQSSTIMLGKALQDPIKGITALTRVGLTFTEAEKKQIEALVKTGQVAKAQEVILKALETQVKGSAQAAQDSDPWNSLQDQFNRLAEDVGKILLPILERVNEQIGKLADRFESLSPETKETVIQIGAFVALAGPLLVALGFIVQGFARLGPLVRAAAGAFGVVGTEATVAAGGITAAETAAAPMLGAAGTLALLAAGAGLVYLAFQDWEDIKPYVDRLGKQIDSIRTKFGPITSENDTFTARFKSQWDAIRAKVAEADKDLHKLDAWAAEFDHNFVTSLDSTWRAFEEWNDRMNVTAKLFARDVSKSIKDGLANARTSVKDWTTDASGWFSDLYQDVVGHSYVPDMVDGIAAQMARLDAVMAQPAKEATSKTAEAFAALREKVAAIFAELFPEAAALNAYRDKLKLLDEDAKKFGYTAEQVAEAKARLAKQDVEPAAPDWWTEKPPEPSFDPNDPLSSGAEDPLQALQDNADKTLTEIGDLNRNKTAEMAEAWGDMAASAIADMRGMVDAFKSGDILGGIQSLLDIVLDVISALARIGTFGSGAQSRAGGGIGFSAGARQGFGGGLMRGGPTVPGKTYLVGENGPEFLSTKRRGFVTPTGKEAQPQKVVVIPSPYFDVVVDQRAAHVAAPMAGQAAVAGVAGSEMRATRRQRRNLLAA